MVRFGRCERRVRRCKQVLPVGDRSRFAECWDTAFMHGTSFLVVIFSVMQLYDDTPETETTKEYSSQFVACFLKTDAESTLQDPFRLLNLLLSHHSLVFKWLMDIKTSQEQQQVTDSGVPPTGVIIGADGKTEVGALYECWHSICLL